MKSPASLCPMGTIKGYFFSYGMAIIYGVLTVFGSIVQLLRDRKKFFQIKERPKPPKCLTDRGLGQHNYIQCKNVKLHYISKGDPNQPLMLFLHGFPEVWYSWRYQIREFSKNYFTVALNMRGYGDSDKPKGVANYSIDKLVDDIRDVVHGLGKQKCILVSHDWGGIVAWMVAAQYPGIVDKHIVCNAPHLKSFMETIESNWKQFFMSWYIYFFNLPFLPELRLSSNDFEMFDKLFQKMGTSEDIEAYKYYFSKPQALTPPINYYRALQRGYGREFYLKIRDKRISSPTLVIWGQNDLALSSSLASDSCQSCDNYTIKMIAECSHWTPIDKPEIVNKYIHEFLAQKH